MRGRGKWQAGASHAAGPIGPAGSEARQLPDWLRGATRGVIAAVFAVGGLISFVAAAGGAIIWVRFQAAELPADQALAALPRGELIASGAVLLSVFVLLGMFAVVGVYMFDAEEYQPRGMLRGLLALVTTECILVVALAVSVDWERRLVACEGILLFGLLLLLVIRWRERLLLPHKEREEGRKGRMITAGIVVGVTVGALAAVTVMWREEVAWTARAVVLAGALGVVLFAISARWVRDGFSKLDNRREEDADKEIERYRRLGKLLIMALTGASLAFASLVMWQGWIAVTLAAALTLGVASWRVAVRTDYNFFVCGVAVFVSVPLIGAVSGIARNYEDPQVQPIALIRADDGASEALQGIYVTETDDRIYFASIATQGCDDEIEAGSGRLVWVRREDVVATALGSPQSVEQAGQQAQEMYYALAPAANPYATKAEVRAARAAALAVGSDSDPGRRRLADLGPALRRSFDLGPVVEPPHARAGEDVKVRHLTGKEREGEGDEVVNVGGAEIDEAAAWDSDARELTFTLPKPARGGVVTAACRPSRPPVVRVRR